MRMQISTPQFLQMAERIKRFQVVTLLNSIVQMMVSRTAMLQIAALLMIPQQEMILQLQKEQYKNSRMVLCM